MRLQRIISIFLAVLVATSNAAYAMAPGSLFQRLSISRVREQGVIVGIGNALSGILDTTTEPDRLPALRLAIRQGLGTLNSVLSADGGRNDVEIMPKGYFPNDDRSISFVLKYREGPYTDRVLVTFNKGEYSLSEDSVSIDEALGRAEEFHRARAIALDNDAVQKGDHVERSYIDERLQQCEQYDIEGHSALVEIIRFAIAEWRRQGDIGNQIADYLEQALREKRIKIVKPLPGTMVKSFHALYVRAMRRMRATFIYTASDVMYIPEELISVFLSPKLMEALLKPYIGDEEYARLNLTKDSLKRRFAGILGHDAYESILRRLQGPSFNVEQAHKVANEKEKLVAGESIYDGESGFDDVGKLIVLRDLGMIPDVLVFDILRDRQRDQDEVIDWGYTRVPLKELEHRSVGERLNSLFGRPLGDGERYYMLCIHGYTFAFARRDSRGNEEIIPIYKDKVSEFQTDINTLIRNYKYISQKVKEYREAEAQGKDALKEWKRRQFILPFSMLDKDDINDIAGGKGASLGEMYKVVKVPPGDVVTVYAFHSFLNSNPEVREFIRSTLADLDITDSHARQQAASEIAAKIIGAIDNIPAGLLEELEIYYSQLEIEARMKDTAVAVRSSGINEDIARALFWVKFTTGSEAGQGATYLNVRGYKNVREKLVHDWASLFTDRAISYRDDQMFIMFLEKVGTEEKLNYIIDKIRASGYSGIANSMAVHRSPGYVNLRNVFREMAGSNLEVNEWLGWLDDSAKTFIDPDIVGISVVVMQMVKSYMSGVTFTVNPATGMAGVTQALNLAWHTDDRDRKGSFVHLDSTGKIIGTRPMVISIECNWGYGETVVGGMVVPDKYTLVTTDGEHWVPIEKTLGSKAVTMVDLEKAFDILESQNIRENRIRELAGYTALALSYEEVDSLLAKEIETRLDMRYLRSPSSDLKENKKRIRLLGKKIADSIKEGRDTTEIKRLISDEFVIKAASADFGLDTTTVDTTVGSIYRIMDEAKRKSQEGLRGLSRLLDVTEDVAKSFLLMLSSVWHNKEVDVQKKDREEVLRSIRFAVKRKGDLLEEGYFRTLAYAIRSIIDGRFTTLMDTSAGMSKRFTLDDIHIQAIVNMVRDIALHYKDQRDIEFAIELNKKGELQIAEVFDVTGAKIGEKERIALFNVQARPYTGPVIGVDLVRERYEVDEKFIEKYGIKHLVKGTPGESAAKGMLYYVDERDLAEQAEDIKRIREGKLTDGEVEILRGLGFSEEEISNFKDKEKDGCPVIIVLREATPEHDPLMKLANAVVTLQGGETSHAAIFCREQNIPCVAGIGRLTGHVADVIKHKNWLVVDANNGLLYEWGKDKDIPVELVKFRVKPYLVPFVKGDPQAALIMAAVKAIQQASPLLLSKAHGGIALSRGEFRQEEIGLNPFAGQAYDDLMAINAGRLRLEDLHPLEQARVEYLRINTHVVYQIERRLSEAGFSSYAEYMKVMYRFFYNTLGFCISPWQINKARAFDFAMDKVRGLTGSELFSWPGHNPLVGLRGASLEIRPEFQRGLSYILDAIIRSNKDFQNHGWMYVFVRTERELEKLLELLAKAFDENDAQLEEVGIMVEIPSDVFIIDRLASRLVEFKKRYPGVKNVFFSFGTNDYTNLAGKTDRDDPTVQNLKILDPAVREEDLQGWFFRKDKDGGLIIPLADEGSDVVMRLIEPVVAEARRQGVKCSLCGQAIVKLIERGAIKEAARIMSLLDSFGTDVKNWLKANMVRFDAMSGMRSLTDNTVSSAQTLFDIKKKGEVNGVVHGKIVYVEKAEDLIPETLKGLSGDELEAKRKELMYNNPKALSRIDDSTIVVIAGRIGTVEELEKRGIDWQDLQYARAIIVGSSIDTSGWDILDPKKGLVSMRIKATADGLAGRRTELEGKTATVDYNRGVVYEGELEWQQEEPQMREIAVPETEPAVDTIKAVPLNINEAYTGIGYHPLVLLAYDAGQMQALKKNFIDYFSSYLELLTELIRADSEIQKDWVKGKLRKRLNEETDGWVKERVLGYMSQEKPDLSDAAIEALADSYIGKLQEDIGRYLGEQKVGSGKELIRKYFRETILNVVNEHPDQMVVHMTTSLNRKEFSQTKGGILIEQVNPNPNYGLLGVARNLNDFWEVYRIELEVFKELRQEHKNLALQLTDTKGTQSGALIRPQMSVLKAVGLIPGEDGLEVGVNISTPSDALSIEYYLDNGITFVSIDRRGLGGAWLGADIGWMDYELVTESEIVRQAEISVLIVKDALAKRGKKLVEFDTRTVTKVVPGEDSPESIAGLLDHVGLSGKEFHPEGPKEALSAESLKRKIGLVRTKAISRLKLIRGFITRNLTPDYRKSFLGGLNELPEKETKGIYAFRFEDAIARIEVGREVEDGVLLEEIVIKEANALIAKTIWLIKNSDPDAKFIVYSDTITRSRMEAALNAIDADGVFDYVLAGDENTVAETVKGNIVFASSRAVSDYRTVLIKRDETRRVMIPFEEIVTVMTELLGGLEDAGKTRILDGYKIWLQQAGFTGDELDVYLGELRRALDESTALVVSLPIPPLPKAGSVIEELDKEYLQKEISTYA